MAVITIVVAMAVGGNGGGTPERVQMVIPPDTLEPTVNITATVEAGIQQGLASRVTPTATQMPATAVPTAASASHDGSGKHRSTGTRGGAAR